MKSLKRYMRGFADMLHTGGVALLGTGATVALTDWNDLSIPFFGVRVTVIMMAAGGSFASFAYGEPVKPRSKLYTMALVNTFLAAVLVAVLPPMMGWQWTSPKLEPPFAAAVGWILRFAVPTFITLIPEVLRKIFRLDKKKEEKDETTRTP